MTKESFEWTLVILKPDAVERKLVGKIIDRLEQIPGMEIVAIRRVFATQKHLIKHFPNSEEWVCNLGSRASQRMEKLGIDPLGYFGIADPHEIGLILVRGCCDYYMSGPLVPMMLRGPNIIHEVRARLGSAMPSLAEKGTIRGDFGEPENADELSKGAARNLIHASDSLEEANREIKAWFSLGGRY